MVCWSLACFSNWSRDKNAFQFWWEIADAVFIRNKEFKVTVVRYIKLEEKYIYIFPLRWFSFFLIPNTLSHIWPIIVFNPFIISETFKSTATPSAHQMRSQEHIQNINTFSTGFWSSKTFALQFALGTWKCLSETNGCSLEQGTNVKLIPMKSLLQCFLVVLHLCLPIKRDIISVALDDF